MTETLRPSTLGEILDRTAQLYRRNFWLFAGVAALPIAIIIAVSALALGTVFAVPGLRNAGGSASSPATALLIALFVIVVLPIYVAAAVFSYAGLTEAAAKVHRGEKITIRGVFNAVRPWFWRYLWFGILQAIVIALVPGAIAGVIIGFLVFSVTLVGGGGTAAGVAIGFLTFFIAFGAFGVIIWRALGYSIGLSVCVVEKKSAWESLQRAWKLSQGTRGRIFVLYLLIAALAMAGSMIGYIVSAIVGAVAGVVGKGSEYVAAAAIVAAVLYLVVDFTVQVLLAPVSWIALVLFYYDQRIRKEGFDIEWMMQQAGLTQPASNALPAEGASISGLVALPDTVEEP
ncbi:MAG: hypothetical protein ABSE53_11635 [Terracidiphilus sp.]|jgi:hypothetical protein